MIYLASHSVIYVFAASETSHPLSFIPDPWSSPQSHKLFGWQLRGHSVPLSPRKFTSKSPRVRLTLHGVNWYMLFISLFDNCPIDTRRLNFLRSERVCIIWEHYGIAQPGSHTVSIKWRLSLSPIKTLQLFTSQRRHRYTHSTREVRICTRAGRTDKSSSAYSRVRTLSIYVYLISKSFSLEVSSSTF